MEMEIIKSKNALKVIEDKIPKKRQKVMKIDIADLKILIKEILLIKNNLKNVKKIQMEDMEVK